MEYHWSKINLNNLNHGVFERQNKMEVISLKWKYIIRRGVPMNIYRIIILDIFKLLYCHNELDYK